MKNLFYLLLMLLVSCSAGEKPLEETIPLNDGWEFKKADAGEQDWLPAKVPGTVHTDLLKNGTIADPFYGCNEKELQWIGAADWIYRKSFTADEKLLSGKHILLVFEGLDTYAEVFLNGTSILVADNMFRRWEVDCRSLLLEGENLLEVKFASAEKRFLADSAAYPYPIPGGRWVFARKAAYHFGWDWGPKFITAGIWKPVYLQSLNNHEIGGLHLFTNSVTDEKAELMLNLAVGSTIDEKATLTITDRESGERYLKQHLQLSTITSEHAVSFAIINPELWWCNGLGEAHLYRLAIELKTSSGYVWTKNMDYGIRTLEVVREADEFGKSLYIRLNGKPVFAKGANIIPPHSFVTEVGAADYEKLVKLALESNMNMLRVWGGGIYKDDEFYRLCDEHGIMVWQDFMFACAMYPGDEAFVENVKQEAIHQVRRLRNHTSLALWCGNNESDEGWHNWGWQKQYNMTANDSAAIWEGYQRIFHQILPDAIKAQDPQRFYISTSPVHGWGRKESLSDGNAHYWGVWWGRQPFEIYLEKVPRFMSEYGFQAPPALSAIRSFQPEAADTLYSPELRCHQKHPVGFETISIYLEREELYPKTPEELIYFGQLVQAKGIRMAMDAHRCAKPRCMGTLYWQLNDCWPVTSWSGTDFHGNRKALQYAVKEGYDDILVSVVMKEDSGSVFLVSDRMTAANGKFEMTLKDFAGQQLWNYEKSTAIPANSSNELLSFSKTTIPGGFDPTRCFLTATFTDSLRTYQSHYFFSRYGKLNLPLTNVETEFKVVEGGFEINVTADKFAAFVHLWLTESHAVFSRNFFHLLPGETITVQCESDLNTDEFNRQLRVKDLRGYLGGK